MSRSRVLLVALFCAALLSPVQPTQAASTLLCSGYDACARAGYSHHDYKTKQGTMYWRMYSGTNCTNYVAYRLITSNGMSTTRPWSGGGNARDWGTAMASKTNQTPRVGSVAWWGRTGNHVAYVERVVSSTEIIVSESNWGRPFDWRRITKSGSGWPDGFIHFTDNRLVNESRPAIIGDARVGQELKASGGVWTPKGNDYGYQWLADGAVISGAAAKTRFLTPTAAQVGKKLSVRVTAKRSGYDTVVVTSPTVTVKQTTLTHTTRPSLTGTPRVGQTLTAQPGTWDPGATSHQYRWTADDVVVPGATSRTLTLTPALVDKRIRADVTAVRAGHAPGVKNTIASKAVAPAPISSTRAPTVSGTPRVGAALTAQPGSWSVGGLAYAYRWSVGGVPVPDATGATFVPRAEDIGRPISVEVTASRAGYVTTSATSGPTASVAEGVITVGTRPVVTGHPRVGSTLRSSGGSWSTDAELTYSWTRDGAVIAGATGPTYVLRTTDLGRKLRSVVVADREGHRQTRAQSVNTPVVQRGVIHIDNRPRLTGTLRPGLVGTVDPGVQRPSDLRVTYRWLRDGKAVTGWVASPTRKLAAADAGRVVAIEVRHAKPGYTTVITRTVARRVGG